MINPYASLADYRSFTTPRGQVVITDAGDDILLADILADEARNIDELCHRTFYPRYEIRWFDVPVYTNSPRNLFLDDDLLEPVTITNGDGNIVSPTVYNLKPKNYSPHYAIQLIGPTSIFWIFNPVGNIEKVISVEGWWGFHNRYTQRAWTLAGTLGAAVPDLTSLNLTMTAGHSLVGDQIIKVDSELFNLQPATSILIASSTNASPIEITTATAHGLTDGAQVTISAHSVNTNANGTWTIAWVSTTKFTLTGSTGNGIGGATGTVTSGSILNNTFTCNQRGDNGSTAATHLTSAPVYLWNVQTEIKHATIQNAQKVYMERLGVTRPIAGAGAVAQTTKYVQADVSPFIRLIS